MQLNLQLAADLHDHTIDLNDPLWADLRQDMHVKCSLQMSMHILAMLLLCGLDFVKLGPSSLSHLALHIALGAG